METFPIINPAVDSQVLKKHHSLGEVQARQMWQCSKATILWELSLPQCQVSRAWCCGAPSCCSPGLSVQVILPYHNVSFVINASQSEAQFEYLADIYPTPHILMQSSKEWVRTKKMTEFCKAYSNVWIWPRLSWGSEQTSLYWCSNITLSFTPINISHSHLCTLSLKKLRASKRPTKKQFAWINVTNTCQLPK